MNLRPATVLFTTDNLCTVFADGRRLDVAYVEGFPGPRVERVLPGHLVAITDSDEVAWRWFDAVVVEQGGEVVMLWEPAHGAVQATPRDGGLTYRPGTRAYLSAGLPGAEWWVAGAVVEDASRADVELDEVVRFFED